MKRIHPAGTPDEKAELQKLYEDLRRQLSVPRIQRLDGRALAAWDEEAQSVQVLRKDGKFGSFGYSYNGKQYLEYFEAMFLLELNRLQLEYHSIIMTIEQAYVLLLGEAASHKYNEYIVYSTLSRVGYILVKHQNVRSLEATQTDCVWELLLSSLQKKPVPVYIKKCPFYARTKLEMEEIKANIMQQEKIAEQHQEEAEISEGCIDFSKCLKPSGKRKDTDRNTNAERPPKRLCAENFVNESSFIDFLKDEPEYKQFQKIFQTFEVCKLKPTEICDDGKRELHINFDLYLHNDGFKKSAPKLPTFRVLIIGPNEPVPTHAEISHCYRRQVQAAPLLVVSVSESKQIQAFLYYFT